MFLDKIITFKAFLNYARFSCGYQVSWCLNSTGPMYKLIVTYFLCSAARVFTPLAPGRNCRGRALSLRAGQRRSDYPGHGPVRAAATSSRCCGLCPDSSRGGCARPSEVSFEPHVVMNLSISIFATKNEVNRYIYVLLVCSKHQGKYIF